jgi:hypothetical protein
VFGAHRRTVDVCGLRSCDSRSLLTRSGSSCPRRRASLEERRPQFARSGIQGPRRRPVSTRSCARS